METDKDRETTVQAKPARQRQTPARQDKTNNKNISDYKLDSIRLMRIQKREKERRKETQ